jgi:hypothetical protein
MKSPFFLVMVEYIEKSPTATKAKKTNKQQPTASHDVMFGSQDACKVLPQT